MEWTPLVYERMDWISLIFLLILGMVAFIKAYHTFRFREFLGLLTNNRYIIIFNKRERSGLLFTFSLLVIQWAILSITIWNLLKYFHIKFSFYAIPDQYLIMVGVALFIFIKIALQRLVSYVFDMDTFSRSYLFVRLSYSNYAGFVLVFLLFLNIYGVKSNIYLFAFSLIVFLYIQVLGLVSFAKLYKNQLKQYWYYFILYICAFEIAPYIFINHWISNQ
jgi:putative membrane protein